MQHDTTDLLMMAVAQNPADDLSEACLGYARELAFTEAVNS